MVKTEQIEIKRHLTVQDLSKRIKHLEKNTMVLKRLYFIKHRYDGKSVEVASDLVDVSKNTGYLWQERWNNEGYEGLIPKFAGGRPSKLTHSQKERLKEILEKGNNWTTKDVKLLISKKFGVDYSEKQIRIILRKFGMNYAKPYAFDHRKPKDATDILKKDYQK
jgi:putative transposase